MESRKKLSILKKGPKIGLRVDLGNKAFSIASSTNSRPDLQKPLTPIGLLSKASASLRSSHLIGPTLEQMIGNPTCGTS